MLQTSPPEAAELIMLDIIHLVESRQQTLLLTSHRLQGLARMDEILVVVWMAG